MAKFFNRIGLIYGRLTVIEPKGKNEKGKTLWLCRCDCGNHKIVVGDYLTAGRTKSCGCLDRENRLKPKKIIHNKSGTHIYREWSSMIKRCSPSYHLSKRYYERGIQVCEDWKSFESFYKFVSQLEHFDEKGYTLERINNDGNYEPYNVRWATNKEQQNNKCNNVYLQYMGKTQTMKQWCEELDLNYGMVKARHQRGWEVPKLFENPHKNQYC